MSPYTLLSILSLLLLVRNANSTGITFTSPGGSATWPPGIVTVTWVDAGGDPNMSELVAYTLELIVGGNSASNSDVLQTIGSPNGTVATGFVEGSIAANISSSVENGFYLRMTSNTTDGNQVINYSNRFTLISMNGTTDQVYLDGANAANGNTDVPSAQYNVIERVTPTSSTTSISATTSATATPTQTSSNPDEGGQDEVPGDALSTAVKIGLIVGGLLAVIGAVSIFVWMRVFWRKRREKQQKEKDQKEVRARRRTAALLEFKAELPAESHNGSRPQPVELSPEAAYHEAGGKGSDIEMQGCDPVFELEGSYIPVHEAGSGRRSQAYEPSLHEFGTGRRSQAYDPTL